MPAKPIELWGHQNEAIAYLLEEVRGPRRWGTVGLPTGAGKTAVLVVVAFLCLTRRHFKRVVILTPFKHTRDAFCEEATFLVGDQPGQFPVGVQTSFWVRRPPTGKRDEAFRRYMHDSAQQEQAIVTTHAQATGGTAKWSSLLPRDCSDTLFLVDEGHHSGEDVTELRHLLDLIQERGGAVANVSATLFRSDDRRIYPTGVVPFVIAYTVLAARGLFPSVLRYRFLGMNTRYRPTNRIDPSDIPKIVQYLLDSGRPVILNLPAGTSDAPVADLAEQFLVEFQKHGVEPWDPNQLSEGGPKRILNAVGQNNGVSERVRVALALEREIAKDKNRGYKHRTLDIVLSCQRFREGADWAMCSHVVCLGVSSSLPLSIQVFGRALRSKRCIQDYPIDWVDDATLTMFVPRMSQTDPDRRKVAKILLEIACLLEGSDAAYTFHRLWPNLVEGMRLPPVERAVRRKFRQLFEHLTQDQEMEVRKTLFAMAVQIRGRLGCVSLGDMVSNIVNSRHSTDAKIRLAAEAVFQATQNGPMQADLSNGLTHLFDRAANAADPVKVVEDGLLKMFEDLGDKYRDWVFDFDTRVGASGLAADIAMDDVQRMVSDMVKARDTWIDPNWSDLDIVQQVIIPYREQYGHLPRRGQGEQWLDWLLDRHVCVADVDNHLRRTGFDLSMLNLVHGHLLQMPPLTVEEIQAALGKVPRAAFQHFRSRHWGSQVDLSLAASTRRLNVSKALGRPGENLVLLDLALRRGWRGLPGGQTLQDLMPVTT